MNDSLYGRVKRTAVCPFVSVSSTIEIPSFPCADNPSSDGPPAFEVLLLIEVDSQTRGEFDRSEKLQLYAEASVVEYWQDWRLPDSFRILQ